MKSNPSIKRVVCSHIFSIQFGKVQQKPCIEKKYIRQRAGRQAGRQARAGMQGGKEIICFNSILSLLLVPNDSRTARGNH